MDTTPTTVAETRIKAHVRPVNSPDALPRRYATPDPAGNGAAPDLSGTTLHPGIVAFFQAMSDKLDMLVSYVSQNQLDSEYAPAEILEIGAKGLALAAAGDYPEGQCLEVVAVISQFPLRLVTAVGVVAGQGARQGEPVRLVTFTRIREEDLEQIVQFVFKEERARIRHDKWGG